MSDPTLKELLKPPFVYLDNIINNSKMGLVVRFPCGEVSAVTINKINKFIITALKEKWERKYGERKRWIEGTSDEGYVYKCPECGESAMYEEFDHETHDHDGPSNYCPNCGAWLDPPVEEK